MAEESAQSSLRTSVNRCHPIANPWARRWLFPPATHGGTAGHPCGPMPPMASVWGRDRALCHALMAGRIWRRRTSTSAGPGYQSSRDHGLGPRQREWRVRTKPAGFCWRDGEPPRLGASVSPAAGGPRGPGAASQRRGSGARRCPASGRRRCWARGRRRRRCRSEPARTCPAGSGRWLAQA